VFPFGKCRNGSTDLPGGFFLDETCHLTEYLEVYGKPSFESEDFFWRQKRGDACFLVLFDVSITGLFPFQMTLSNPKQPPYIYGSRGEGMVFPISLTHTGSSGLREMKPFSIELTSIWSWVESQNGMRATRSKADIAPRLERQLRDLHLPSVKECFTQEAERARKDSASYEAYLLELVEQETADRKRKRIERYVSESRAAREEHGDVRDRPATCQGEVPDKRARPHRSGHPG